MIETGKESLPIHAEVGACGEDKGPTNQQQDADWSKGEKSQCTLSMFNVTLSMGNIYHRFHLCKCIVGGSGYWTISDSYT